MTPDRFDLTALNAMALRLSERVATLSYDSHATLKDLRYATARLRRHAKWLLAVVVLEAVLTIAGGVVAAGQQHNLASVNALTARLDTAQTTQRRATLCPLYEAILAEPVSPAAANAVAVIRTSYEHLQCVPPTPVWPAR